MGKIVSSFFISLDGVVEAPDQWHFPYFNEEMEAAIGKSAETVEAFLMGRVLYEEWASYWPESDAEPFASFFNNTPKYVVSSTLKDPTWNNTTVISADVATR
ncbi:MAG: dihydrofolate reductase family protein, partial [Actinomycetota bacterium]